MHLVCVMEGISAFPLSGRQLEKRRRNGLLVTEPGVAAYKAMEVDVGLLVLREESFKSLCNTFAVIQVRLGAVRNMAIPDFLGGRTESSSSVLKQTLLFLRAEHTEEVARLRVVVVIVFAEIKLLSISVDCQWRLRVIGLLLPLAMTVRLVAGRAAIVSVDAHRTVTMVSAERAHPRAPPHL